MPGDGASTNYKLKHPFSYTDDFEDKEVEVTKVTLPKRLKGKHLKAMDKATGEVGKTFALVSKVTGLPPEAMEEMDAEDVENISDRLSAPLESAQGTGRKHSG